MAFDRLIMSAVLLEDEVVSWEVRDGFVFLLRLLPLVLLESSNASVKRLNAVIFLLGLFGLSFGFG